MWALCSLRAGAWELLRARMRAGGLGCQRQSGIREAKCLHGSKGERKAAGALYWGAGGGLLSIPSELEEIELKSLILAQIERWRHALHMQVERQHGGNPGGEWRTGE